MIQMNRRTLCGIFQDLELQNHVDTLSWSCRSKHLNVDITNSLKYWRLPVVVALLTTVFNSIIDWFYMCPKGIFVYALYSQSSQLCITPSWTDCSYSWRLPFVVALLLHYLQPCITPPWIDFTCCWRPLFWLALYSQYSQRCLTPSWIDFTCRWRLLFVVTLYSRN